MHPNNPDAPRFAAAAAALVADAARSHPGADGAGLLRFLSYDDANLAAAPGRVRMLRAAGMLRRLFLLPVPDAPGMVFFGGEADSAMLGVAPQGTPLASVAGSGLEPRRAFESCVGEAIEYLSQFVRPGDRIERRTAADAATPQGPATRRFIKQVLDGSEVDPARAISWVPARTIGSRTEAWFPADLCLRRSTEQRDFVPPLQLSTGCAAGVTMEAATLRAMLELIERDAAALWWRGGRRGRAILADGEAGRAAAELLAALRQGNQDRHTWLLDIATDLGIPVVAAVSSGPNGYGFAFGLGCRLTQADAARAAIFEMCQVELGPHVVAAKRQESGDDALQEGDLRHLRRTTLIDTRACPLLQPVRVADVAEPAIPTDPASALQFLSQRLAEHDITAFSLDLTRADFDIPMVRVLAPGLQLEPCRIIGERLASAIRETGGGAPHTGGLSLL